MENGIEKILNGLNEEQKNAVEAIEGPVLIVAGAGSGKTRVLTSRVAYILASGVDPHRVLALTFTKKAASEMKERIAIMVGHNNAKRVVMGTFHAIFVRFLREYADSLGYPADFTIYDTSDSVSAMKSCIKEFQLDDKIYKPKEVLGRISMAKNNLITPAAYSQSPEIINSDIKSRKPQISKLYERYQNKLKDSGVMDFDDILVNMNILLRDNAQARQRLCERFSYIMVDEYQDTNFAQYNILKRLTTLHHNICVVGDDSQSIYAFRGAQVQNILNFKKDFPESKIFRLERNYRSTKVIVNAANSVIAHNSSRIPKDCYSEGAEGEKIRVFNCGNESDEAANIIYEIGRRISSDGAGYGDFAILYRTNAQSRALEDALRRRNIPYMVYSGNSFFERAEVKDMMAYFKLVLNVHDDESFKRAIGSHSRGIGASSVAALTSAANAHAISLFKSIWLDDLEQFGLKPSAVSRFRDFGDKFGKLASKVQSVDAYTLAKEIADESGYPASLKADNSFEAKSRYENVSELLDSVASYVQERNDEAEQNGDDVSEATLADYMENISLLSNADTSGGEDGQKVSLMTVHAAKGLEYDYVFVAGMENNLFPSLTSLGSSKELEEERRLFYVALTRAKKSVVLSHCNSRMRNGKTETNDISMFVKEIDPKYLSGDFVLRSPSFGFYGNSSAVRYEPRSSYRSSSSTSRTSMTSNPRSSANQPKLQTSMGGMPIPKPRPSSTTPPAVQLDFVPDDMSVFRVGQRIEHNRFGAGRILSITGIAPELRAEVEFDAYGKKLLLLKYAKMRREKE